MSNYFTRLNYSIINKYTDRKHSGMLNLFYNTKIKSFIAVPRNIEHATLVAGLLNASLDDIKNKVVDTSHFIPVTLIITNNKYQSMIVGSSSLEMGLGVKHNKSDLINAKNAAIVLLERSPLKIKEDFKEVVIMKYAY